ncbi:hypothetical protein LOK49_LG07G03527 [Camellia lanceoleosa]|uniref:Uncharacterized protein n=1 Tax=Camellia lanceoleosa TaxID=1840588 RepID=A0ACC0HBE1_9ERIC|nr:hypothetical protein LOK49_LG07G03527 [Camellia lanceoleosa]
MTVPELEDGTPSSRVRPMRPSRRKESPRSVMFRKEKDGKSKLVLCSANANGGCEKLRRKKMRTKKTRRFLGWVLMDMVERMKLALMNRKDQYWEWK